MTLLNLRIAWVRDEEGYDLEFAAQTPEQALRFSHQYGPSVDQGPDDETPLLLREWDPVRIVGKGGKNAQYQTTNRHSRHFIEFAKIRNSAQAIQFFNRHGPLTEVGQRGGEPLSFVLQHATIFDAWLTKAKPPKTTEVMTRLDVSLMRDGSKSQLQIAPRTLLSLMYLQLAQSLAGDRPVRSCELCGDLFEVGKGTGRKLSSKFCKPEHQVRYNSLKRSWPP